MSINLSEFKSCLWNELRKEDFVNDDKGFEKFCNISMNVLNMHISRKKKLVRGNQIPFMTKDLSKKITKKARLRNRFLRDKSLDNRLLCGQEGNYSVSLSRKTKLRYYANLYQKKS